MKCADQISSFVGQLLAINTQLASRVVILSPYHMFERDIAALTQSPSDSLFIVLLSSISRMLHSYTQVASYAASEWLIRIFCIDCVYWMPEKATRFYIRKMDGECYGFLP